MDNRAIGVFDSGVGGLTVFSQLAKVLPNENMIYLGDTKQFPYGNKSKETIIELSKRNIEFLIKKRCESCCNSLWNCNKSSFRLCEELI